MYQNNSPKKPQLSQQKDIRQRLQEAMNRFELKQVQVSKETGIHHSSLSLWLQGKIRGHQVGIDETIENYLHNLYSNKPRFSKDGICFKFYQVKEKINETFIEEQIEKYFPIEINVNFNDQDEVIKILWNYNEKVVTSEQLAKRILDDKGLPNSYEQDILNQLEQQFQDIKHFNLHSVPLQDEQICIISLNINSEGIKLIDQFEWDISEEANNPLEFAQLMVNELGLPQIFENLICYEIYKQIYTIKKHIFMRDSMLVTSYRESKKRGRKKDEFKIEHRIKNTILTPQNVLRPLDTVNIWSPQIELQRNFY